MLSDVLSEDNPADMDTREKYPDELYISSSTVYSMVECTTMVDGTH